MNPLIIPAIIQGGTALLSAWQARKQGKQADAAMSRQLDLLERQFGIQEMERAFTSPIVHKALTDIQGAVLPTDQGVADLFRQGSLGRNIPTYNMDQQAEAFYRDLLSSSPSALPTGLPDISGDPEYWAGRQQVLDTTRSGLASRGLLSSQAGVGLEGAALARYEQLMREGQFNRQLQKRQQLVGEAIQNAGLEQQSIANKVGAAGALTGENRFGYQADVSGLGAQQQAALQYLRLIQQPTQFNMSKNQFLSGVNSQMPDLGPQANFFGNQAGMHGQAAQGLYGGAGNALNMLAYSQMMQNNGGLNTPSTRLPSHTTLDANLSYSDDPSRGLKF